MAFGLLFGSGNRSLAGWVAVCTTLLGLGISLYALPTPPHTQIWSTDWIHFQQLTVRLEFRLDAIGKMMLVLVHGVALLVQLYSLSYMHDDARKGRYFAYLQLFVGAMLGIILAGNLVILYAFWELVGLASLLLIGFWYDRPAAAAAAKKAFLMNRIGDAAFLLGILMTYLNTGSFDFGTAPLPTIAGVCLFMGCVAKSAQFPLLTWLPDAMEGPTPVSALLHAATMVAAGIFLLARIHPMLSPDALLTITLVGTLTTVWAGFSALFQSDIKRVLAFSTISQLGLMVAAMGTGNVGGALFHLLTHAFFKAGLFLAAGSVIHAVHTQDMHQMGGLRKALPHTYLTYLICAAALAGVPLLSGFLSKEAILGGAFGWADERGWLARVVPITLLLSSGLTAVYMARQVRLIFFGQPTNTTVLSPHEPDWLMRGPVWLLTILSVGFWFSLNPLSAHSSWVVQAIGQTLPEGGPVWLAPVSIVLVGLGGWLGFRLREPAADSQLAQASQQYGYLDQAYQRIITGPTLWLASLVTRTDRRVVDGVVDGIGLGTVMLAHLIRFLDRFGVDGLVNGAGKVAMGVGQLTRSVQGGRIQTYIATALAVVILVLWLLL
ncbi:NADH-quinone oxidoreductase subunit 5 family protein [Fibrella forsythiae]|uniref:NADH-quinone oxidoreductase subunit L n=1 Tax=Fibrella forsythiae TaxID=2817061 RepID=A0ABS3JKK2_9BACT|nr:NADH-quinone oxidoreductase subunit L [Fibrella forsythiae]